MDTTAITEYEALARLSKANRRANSILLALLVVILLGALFGGWSIYKAQQASFEKQTSQRAANTANALKENRIIQIESIRYLTCLNLLPVSERTPAAQRDCFRKADLPGGLTEDDFVTIPPEIVKSTRDSVNSNPSSTSPSTTSRSSESGQKTSPSSSSTSSSSSSQNNSNDQNPQHTYSQCVTQKSGILSKIGGVFSCI